jgi:hypothetical protein
VRLLTVTVALFVALVLAAIAFGPALNRALDTKIPAPQVAGCAAGRFGFVCWDVP